jgi:hypothetical protein
MDLFWGARKSLKIAAFFLVLGTLIISLSQTKSYVGTSKFGSFASLGIHGHQYVFSAPLIQVAAWLAAGWPILRDRQPGGQ